VSTLLERAIGYAARTAGDVTPALLPRPTPCRRWTLDMLLRHACESLTALHEGTVTGHIGLIPAPPECADPARAFRHKATALLAATATADRAALDIGDLPLTTVVMHGAGALELAVHGWDISQACGTRRPIPDPLADALLSIASLLIADTERQPLFGPPVTVPAWAGPGDRLVAFLGRDPIDSDPDRVND
jgi:uncharacterized protein (TIGR03086 family)